MLATNCSPLFSESNSWFSIRFTSSFVRIYGNNVVRESQQIQNDLQSHTNIETTLIVEARLIPAKNHPVHYNNTNIPTTSIYQTQINSLKAATGPTVT